MTQNQRMMSRSKGGYNAKDKQMRKLKRQKVNKEWHRLKDSGKFKKRYGSKSEVYKGTAHSTKGNPPLVKADIIKKCRGKGEDRQCRYMSKKRSEQALKRWKSDPNLRKLFKKQQDKLREDQKKKGGSFYHGGRKLRKSRRRRPSRSSRRKSRRKSRRRPSRRSSRRIPSRRPSRRSSRRKSRRKSRRRRHSRRR